jgi:ankyrin repeat protein
MSALMLASDQGNMDTVALLVKRGAEIHTKDEV